MAQSTAVHRSVLTSALSWTSVYVGRPNELMLQAHAPVTQSRFSDEIIPVQLFLVSQLRQLLSHKTAVEHEEM